MIIAKFFIEAKSNKKGEARRSLEKLFEEIKKNLIINKGSIAEEIFEEGFFSSFLDVEISFKNMKEFIESSLRLAPVLVEVYKPSKIELNLREYANLTSWFINVVAKFYSKYNIFIRLFGEKIRLIEKEKVEDLLYEGYMKVKLVFHYDENLLKFLSENYYAIDYKIDKTNKLIAVYLILKPYELFSIILKRIPVYIKIEDAEEIYIKNYELQELSLEISSIINQYIFHNLFQKLPHRFYKSIQFI